ncbi:MAG: aspartate kinase, partial [Nanoarchaeota archaeon]
EIVKSNLGRKPVVVVSAVRKITDRLIELAKLAKEGNGDEVFSTIKNIHYGILEKLNMEKNLLDKDLNELQKVVKSVNGKVLDAKTLDLFQSFGERMSSKIVAAQLSKNGMEAQAFNAFDLGLITNSDFGNAEPLEEAFGNLNNSIKKIKVIPVITGFIGKTREGEITTLGRGGSDYTAGIVGAAINASEIQIWTDVDGIMSADPKIIENARTLTQVSFAEASEIAYFGAKVLHPKTIIPAMEKNIPVRVLNTFNPKGNGTLILNEVEKNKQTVKAITSKRNITLIHVNSKRMLGAYGFLARLFDVFYKYKQSVDVVSTSEVSVSMTADNGKNIADIASDLKGIADVKILENKAVICVVGEGMRHTPGVSGRTFSVLGKNKINIEMISQGASEINITFVVDGKDAENAVKVLHKEYYG